MRIAIVADWLPVYSGAEQVIHQFHLLWPDAPIFTTLANRDALGPLQNADIRTTHLQKWYKLLGKHRVLLPWMPKAMEGIDLSEYDVVLSSSHAVGKGIVPPSHAKHICYCHTTMRYAWEMEDEYLRDSGVPRFLHKRAKRLLSHLRRWDMTTADRTDFFLANSTTTAERIRRAYNRESTVLTPPVDDTYFSRPLISIHDRGPFVAIGRLVPYKRFDLLIEAANASNTELIIAGGGPDLARLKSLAGPTVSVLGYVSEEKKEELYSTARAVLFPQMEDAGIVPLEAQASGTPVLAYGKGGVLDTVVPGKTGQFFTEQTVESVVDAFATFDPSHFDPEAIREHAKQFRAEVFREKVREFVTK